MTTSTADDQLVRYTDAWFERRVPAALLAARIEVLATVAELQTLTDATLSKPWLWKGGSEEEVRYGFYRIGEAFERAGIDADASLRSTAASRGRSADLIAPVTAARWDLQGLLIGLEDAAWDADPGGGEWTVRQTLSHLISGQRAYGVATAWWQDQGYPADDPELPAATPEPVFDGLPAEEAEANGTPAEVRDRLDLVVDRAAERLAGLPPDRLGLGARWSGFAVDIGFRFGRWSSHIREHTVQVEKTLVMLNAPPSEVSRLVRLVLAGWGRAEAVVYGSAEAGADAAVAILAGAAASARSTATEIAGIARG